VFSSLLVIRVKDRLVVRVRGDQEIVLVKGLDK